VTASSSTLRQDIHRGGITKKIARERGRAAGLFRRIVPIPSFSTAIPSGRARTDDRPRHAGFDTLWVRMMAARGSIVLAKNAISNRRQHEHEFHTATRAPSPRGTRQPLRDSCATLRGIIPVSNSA